MRPLRSFDRVATGCAVLLAIPVIAGHRVADLHGQIVFTDLVNEIITPDHRLQKTEVGGGRRTFAPRRVRPSLDFRHRDEVIGDFCSVGESAYTRELFVLSIAPPSGRKGALVADSDPFRVLPLPVVDVFATGGAFSLDLRIRLVRRDFAVHIEVDLRHALADLAVRHNQFFSLSAPSGLRVGGALPASLLGRLRETALGTTELREFTASSLRHSSDFVRPIAIFQLLHRVPNVTAP